MVAEIRVSIKQSWLLALSIAFFLLLESSWIFNHVISDSVRHGLSYAVLFVAIIIVNKRVKLYKQKSSVIWLLLIYLYGRFFSHMTFLELIDIVLLPLVIAGSSECIKYSNRKICSAMAMLLFLINAFVCVYEYKNGVNLFYFDMNNMIRFRSTGIWGHPLYTAVIDAATMFFILLSDLRKIVKICFWFAGMGVLFMCDARAAIVSVVACTLVFLSWQKILSTKNLIYVVLIIAAAYMGFGYLSTSDLGGKLFAQTSSGSINYDGMEYRLIALKVLFDMDFSTLMSGVENQFMYVHKYGVKCAENGFVARVLVYGLPIAIATFYLNVKTLLYVCRELKKKYRYLIVALLIVAAITNQSLLTGYIWNTYMFMYLLLKSSSLDLK